MSGLAWVRLDTGWPRNRKVINLLTIRGGERALITWVSGICYAGEQGSDGYIPAAALAFVHGTKTTAKLLVEEGLWHPVEGGWQINDWADYQESNEETQKRKEKAKRAASARWGTTTAATPF